jgi:hypothetical protein
MTRRIVALVTLSAAVLLTGCAGLAASGGSVVGSGASGVGGTASAASARQSEPTEGRKALERAVAQYEQGKFVEAIRLLQESPEIVADGAAVRAEALKMLAFAQCVAGRRPACRRTFDALLVLDPAFELAPVETGHPSWGPEYDRAKAAAKTAGPAAATAARR